MTLVALAAACLTLSLLVAAVAIAAPRSRQHPAASGKLTASPSRALNRWTGARLDRVRPLPPPASGARRAEPSADASGTEDGRSLSAAEPTFVPAADPGGGGSSRLRRGLAGRAATASASSAAAVTDYTTYPASANGVLVGAFARGSGEEEYRCSAAVIDSAAGNLVLTAGHCVIDSTTGEVARWLVFVPGYHEGSLPFGQWAASEYGVTRTWARTAGSASGADESGDVAILRMRKRESDGASVQSVVGALGIGFDQPRNQTYALYGYPAKSPYDGEDLYLETSSFAGVDAGFSPATIKVASDFSEGASGGPWTIGTSELLAVSVTAYAHTEAPGYVYGPFFGTEAKSLYRRASNPASSTESAPERLHLTSVQRLPSRGSARLIVSVPAAGKLSLRGRGVESVERNVDGGSAVVALRAKGAALRTLRRTGRVSVRATLTYGTAATPVVGRLSKTVSLVQR